MYCCLVDLSTTLRGGGCFLSPWLGGKLPMQDLLHEKKKIYCSLIEPLSSLGKMQPGLTRGSSNRVFRMQYRFNYSITFHRQLLFFHHSSKLCQRLREDPNGLTPPPFGHCQIAIGPPPSLYRALWGTFFRAIFTILQGCMLPKTVEVPQTIWASV